MSVIYHLFMDIRVRYIGSDSEDRYPIIDIDASENGRKIGNYWLFVADFEDDGTPVYLSILESEKRFSGVPKNLIRAAQNALEFVSVNHGDITHEVIIDNEEARAKIEKYFLEHGYESIPPSAYCGKPGLVKHFRKEI